MLTRKTIGREGRGRVGGNGRALDVIQERGKRLQGGGEMQELIAGWCTAGSLIPEVSYRRDAFHYAHLLATTRRVTPKRLGVKTTIELSDTDHKKRGLGPAATEIEAIRERWADMSNAALARNGHDARIDHRSLAAQREEALRAGDAERAEELNREPTKHLGVAATAMERRGERTDFGQANRRIAEAAESGRLERERQALEGSIVDVSGDLTAALKERDTARSLQRHTQPDALLALEARRQAREAWTALRSQAKEARNQAGLWRDAL